MFRRRVFTHHHVGDSRLVSVFGRKSENQINRCDLSAKGHLPCLPKGCLPEKKGLIGGYFDSTINVPKTGGNFNRIVVVFLAESF
jgi:hypothetical protein